MNRIEVFWHSIINSLKTPEKTLMDKKTDAGIQNKTLVIHPDKELIKQMILNEDFQGLSEWGMKYINAIKEMIEEIRSFKFAEYEELLFRMEDDCDVDLHEINYFADLSDEEICDWFDLVSEYLQESIDLKKRIICLSKYRQAIKDKYDEVCCGLEELEGLNEKLQSSQSFLNSGGDSLEYEEYIATVYSDISPMTMVEISFAEMNDDSFGQIINAFDDVINQTDELITEAKHFLAIDRANSCGGQLPMGANTLDELDQRIRVEREQAEKVKEERIANASKSISIAKGNTSGTGGFAERFGKGKQDEAKTPETNINENDADEE